MPNRRDVAEFDAVQNFLKAVYALQQESDERVSTNALAEMLRVKAPSITDMARRMVDAGLVDYERYKGVRLTENGAHIALKVIRRHRLIELYLMQELGYALYEVHDEAEKLEHAVSDRFIEALAQKLGDPQIDPHGDPIPDEQGVMAQRHLLPLAQLPENTPARVSRLTADTGPMLQHILDRGFKLEADVEVLERDPFDGPISVLVNGERRVVGYHIAACIWVEAQDTA
ncbi:MAG: metal-dependent transcriptional regulator [Chloroflexi bacterium]|nr:metal-dependent transcriptional regulator [Chloroflexota bacterium]